MAAAQVDEKIIAKLISTRLETLSSAAIHKRHWGEDALAAPGTLPYVQLVALDVEYEHRTTGASAVGGDAPDQATIVLSMTIGISDAQVRTDAYALRAAVSLVRSKMSRVSLEDAATGHVIELDEAVVNDDPGDELKRALTAGMTVNGLAYRLAGATLS